MKRKRQDKRRQNKTKVQGVEIKRRELRALFFNALSSCLVFSCLFSEAKRYESQRRPCGKATETLCGTGRGASAGSSCKCNYWQGARDGSGVLEGRKIGRRQDGKKARREE
jgi:hypothetical protein